MEPGPILAAFLAGIDIRRLRGCDRVVVLQAHQRMAAHCHAQALDAMTSLVEAYDTDVDHDGTAPEGAAAEIRVALHLTRRAADTQLELALGLRRRLPQVAGLLRRGLLDVPRARVILETTEHLPVVDARRIVTRIIDDAPELTTGQLRARLRRLCMNHDPAQATDRYRHAVDRRHLMVRQTPEGVVDLWAFNLPADRAIQAADRIDTIARSLRRKGATRTMDQLRADVLVDLLCGTSQDSPPGRVDLHVELTTLMGLTDHAGELPGIGPIPADIARQVIADHADGQWTYTVTHQGRPVATGTLRRRPTTAQRRHVQARTRTCAFPGCRMPATACDLDHTDGWADTHHTRIDKLAPGCRHDHGIKHRYGWTYTIDPDGTIHWHSPLGQHIIIHPP